MVELKLIDEYTKAEVKVGRTLAVEVKMAENTAEPEAHNVHLETSTKIYPPRFPKKPTQQLLEQVTVEEVPVAIVNLLLVWPWQSK